MERPEFKRGFFTDTNGMRLTGNVHLNIGFKGIFKSYFF